MKNDSLFQRLRELGRRLMGRGPLPPPPWPDSPEDPYAGVREPKFRKPGGRSSAVALQERESEQAT